MGKAATKLNNEIRVAVSRAFPGIVTLWPSGVLTAWVTDSAGIEHPIQAGKSGQGDLSGIVTFRAMEARYGVRLEVETKVRRDSQRATQEAFQSMIERFGGIYIITKNTETVLKRLEEELGVARKA